MNDPDLSRASWKKSSRSNGSSGNCVEVARVDGLGAMRDTKNRKGGTVTVPTVRFAVFLAAVKDGRFG